MLLGMAEGGVGGAAGRTPGRLALLVPRLWSAPPRPAPPPSSERAAMMAAMMAVHRSVGVDATESALDGSLTAPRFTKAENPWLRQVT